MISPNLPILLNPERISVIQWVVQQFVPRHARLPIAGRWELYGPGGIRNDLSWLQQVIEAESIGEQKQVMHELLERGYQLLLQQIEGLPWGELQRLRVFVGIAVLDTYLTACFVADLRTTEEV